MYIRVPIPAPGPHRTVTHNVVMYTVDEPQQCSVLLAEVRHTTHLTVDGDGDYSVHVYFICYSYTAEQNGLWDGI